MEQSRPSKDTKRDVAYYPSYFQYSLQICLRHKTKKSQLFQRSKSTTMTNQRLRKSPWFEIGRFHPKIKKDYTEKYISLRAHYLEKSNIGKKLPRCYLMKANTYVRHHGQSKKKAYNANNCSYLSSVRQQFFLPIVDNSSNQWFNAAEFSIYS